MARGMTQDQAAAIRQAIALEELAELGARVALQELNCIVVYLHSTKGKRRSFTAHSATAVLEEVRSFIESQSRLKPDAASRFDVAMGDGPEAEIIQRKGSEVHRAESQSIRRTIEFDALGQPHLIEDAKRI